MTISKQATIISHLPSLWETMREPVIKAFPSAPGLPKDAKAYLSFVDSIYQNDAYHSLSLEEYRVTPELIDRVCADNWSPYNDHADQQRRVPLLARGYWQAFQLVRATISEIIRGSEPVSLVRKVHNDWYRELFQPYVVVGQKKQSDVDGYRNKRNKLRHNFVFFRKFRHVPLHYETVSDAMSLLFDLLETETEPSVRAVLGHWLFGYIHPYPDGNGRMARFVMNVTLASGGYPWIVIQFEDRDGYLAALERAIIDEDIGPLAQFVADRVVRSQELAE